jgi:hypothetical protein
MMSYTAEEIEAERQLYLRNQRACRGKQEQWDNALRGTGFRARPPRTDETYDDYRRNMAADLKKMLPGEDKLRQTKYWDLRADALDVMETQLMRAVHTFATSNDSVPAGSMREVVTTGRHGEKVHSFLGTRSFIHDFVAPIRKVAYFRTSTGPIRTDGRPVT